MKHFSDFFTLIATTVAFILIIVDKESWHPVIAIILLIALAAGMSASLSSLFFG